MVELEASKIFCDLPPEDLKRLRGMAIEQRFEAGSGIFKEGDSGGGIYVVKNGQVEISVLLNAETRHRFAQIGPGEMFGEMAVIDDKPRSACAVALQPTTVYLIPRTEINELMERSPALATGLLREITQRLREFNRQYVREVLQAERLAIVGRFARSIVHDLKNPLNIIGITAELADMEQATSETRHLARERIGRQVERINDLINEILEFTQGAHGDFVAAPADYAAFVRSLADELQPELALKSVSVELEFTISEVQILIDPKRLRRVFENLIHNATEAMPEGGRIRIRLFLKPEEVVTEIEDTGPGVAPEIANRLFETFATYGKAHGTGLGLSICKRIIQDHHGWISARNEPERGATFTFGLPRPKPRD